MNPFEAPEAQEAWVAPDDSTFDIGTAFSDGLDAMKRNFVTWLLMGLALFVIVVVLEVTFIGIFALPIVMWGAYKYSLDTLDGEPEFGVLFSGTEDPGKALVGIGGAILIMMAVLIPCYLVLYLPMMGGFGLQMAIAPDADTPVFVILGGLLSIPTLFIIIIPLLRLQFAPYFVVDQGMGPMEASKAAWQVTKGQSLKLMLFMLLMGLMLIAGELMLFIGLIPASMIQYAAMASIYRQLSGTRKA